MNYLGMKLYAINVTRRINNGSIGAVICLGNDFKAHRQFFNPIPMTHPDDGLLALSEAFEEGRIISNGEQRLPVLSLERRSDLSFE